MIEYSDDIKEDVIYYVAKKMVAAAITAPKASGSLWKREGQYRKKNEISLQRI